MDTEGVFATVVRAGLVCHALTLPSPAVAPAVLLPRVVIS